MTKEELIDGLTALDNKGYIKLILHVELCAEELLESLNSLPNGEASRVSKNEGEKRICPTCNGKGKIWSNMLLMDVNCFDCDGKGEI